MDDQRVHVDDYECFVFCETHVDCGKKDLKQGGKERLKQTTFKSQISEKLRKFGLT